MKIPINEHGLYEFDITVKGRKKEQTLKGLVDTGSTDCACTYKVITTLQIRPIDYRKVSTINNETKNVLIYSGIIGFDEHNEIVPLLRVTSLPEGIHFILGMSILSKCKIEMNGSHLDINWKKESKK